MNATDSPAQGTARRWLLLIAGFAAVVSGCGRSTSRTDGTAGTATSTAGRGGAGGAGGSTGDAGATAGVDGTGGSTAGAGATSGTGGSTGGADATGGTGGSTAGTGATAGVGGTGGSTGGTGGSGGSGGEAGAPLENPTECVGIPSSRGACEGGCAINAAFALRCPSPLTDIELADWNLLIEHATGASLYAFHHEGGLIVQGDWDDPAVRRELAVDGEVPIVVHETADGDILVSPASTAGGTHELAAGLLLDAAYDDETLRVLESNANRVTLHSIAADGSVTSDLVSDDASAASLVRRSSPPRMALVNSAGAASIYGDGGPRTINLPSPVRVDTPWFSAVALGDRLVLGSLTPGTDGTDGIYFVEDAGVARSFGATRTQSCPEDYVAEYPDICEFELVPDVIIPGAVLAAELVVHAGEPWLVSIVGEVTDQCRTFTGRCFESQPCDCEYRRFGSTANAALRLENLDDPTRVLRVELGDFSYETVQLAVSSSEAGALFIAIAEGQFSPGGGSHAGVAIDYLMLTP